MRYSRLNILAVVVLAALLSSCRVFSFMEKVQEDKRNQYQTSQPLPDLEVPPDLLLESDELALRTSQDSPPDRRQQTPAAPAAVGKDEPAGLGLPEPQARRSQFGDAVPAVPTPGVLEISASREQLWPVLKEYFEFKGRELNVDDFSLGVIETAWSVPYLQQESMVRDRVSVLVEPGSNQQVTRLAFSSDMQVFRKGGSGDEGDWELSGRAEQLELGMKKELEQFITKKI